MSSKDLSIYVFICPDLAKGRGFGSLCGSELGLRWSAEGREPVSADFTFFFAAIQATELTGSSGTSSFKLD